MVDIVIEIPYNSFIKYEHDKACGRIRCDRILNTAMTYPGNYGYFPRTLASDGDALDVLLVTDYALVPGSVIECKILGVLLMRDEAGIDEKVIAVPTSKVDSNYADIDSLQDLSSMTLKKIKHFFSHYKDTDPEKWSKVEDFENKEYAESLLRKYQIDYQNRKDTDSC